MKHTKEPWRVGRPSPNGQQVIGNGRGMMIAIANPTGTQGEVKANAERIVACVNACQGITTEALEKGVIANTLKSYEDLFISREMYRYKHIKDIENSISKSTITCCGYKIWEVEV